MKRAAPVGVTAAAAGAIRFANSRRLQEKAHRLIPGGCHTYAKGDDQYPMLAPGFIRAGKGCHVWDIDGNEFIEYGMGCRSVTLGHGFPPVVPAAAAAMAQGANFTRPAPIEVACAEEFLAHVDTAEMVKFAKDGSTATTPPTSPASFASWSAASHRNPASWPNCADCARRTARCSWPTR